MKRMAKQILFIVLVAVIFGVGFFVGKAQVVCSICPPEEVDFSLFWEAWHQIQEGFAFPERLDEQVMIHGAISGMISSLEDPHTVFFTPENAQKFLADIRGQFEGVGMEIGQKQGELQVIAPLEDTPAQKAGLRSGDKIIKIDDTFTADLTIEEAVTLIRGPKGSEVILTIMRGGWESSKEITITRAVINVPSLKWELLTSDSSQEELKDVAYIRIYHFSEKASSEFAEIALSILESPAKKIILDLRNNPGGLLEESRKIAGWFLERDQIVVMEDFGGKREQTIYQAKGNARLLGYPIVILINQGSASASEILASAIRDNRSATIVGETSFGKGSVQKLEELRDNSYLKITTSQWLTPDGISIGDNGLEPDIVVEITEEDYEQERDPQLDKALEILGEVR